VPRIGRNVEKGELLVGVVAGEVFDRVQRQKQLRAAYSVSTAASVLIPTGDTTYPRRSRVKSTIA
jgi:hypothetical protein